MLIVLFWSANSVNLVRKMEEHSSTKGSSWAKAVMEYTEATFLRFAAWRVGLRSVKRSTGPCGSALPLATYQGLYSFELCQLRSLPTQISYFYKLRTQAINDLHSFGIIDAVLIRSNPYNCTYGSRLDGTVRWFDRNLPYFWCNFIFFFSKFPL